jgi:Pilus formation protein N terminal region
MTTVLHHKSAAIVLASFLVVPAGVVAAQQPRALDGTQDTIHATKGIASIYRLKGEESFATISVGDPNIVNVTPLTDHSIVIQARQTGTTNLIFLDSAKTPVKDVAVVIDAQGSKSITIHDKAMLNSYTKFSCGNKGCQFAGENTVEEPAPLPRGNSTSTVNQSVSGEVGPGQQAATVTVTAPPTPTTKGQSGPGM